MPKGWIAAALLVPGLLAAGGPAGAAAPVPFGGVNRSPLSGLFAPLPALPAAVPRPGAPRLRVTLEAASHFNSDRSADEFVWLDGETQALGVEAAVGTPAGWELGAQATVLGHNGGVFDAFVEAWHRAFRLPQGGRDREPHGRILFSHREAGTALLELDRPTWGLGDLRLWVGHRAGNAAVLRGWMGVPTGRSASLLGPGTTQAGLRLDAGGGVPRLRAGWFAGAAAWAGGRGDVLPERRRPWRAGATVGAEWSPWDPVVFRAQLDAATPAFHSGTRPLGVPAFQLWTGGSLRISGSAWLDLAVGEDVAVDTAPDVTFLASFRTTL